MIWATLLIGLIQFFKRLGQSQLIDMRVDQGLRDDEDRERLNVLHRNWNNTGVIPHIPANQPFVNNFGEPLEQNEEPHQILIDENVTNENEIEGFHTIRNNLGSHNNLHQNQMVQANSDALLPVPEPLVTQSIESQGALPTQRNQANDLENSHELPIDQHDNISNSDNRIGENNDEENMTLEERLWMQADALFADDEDSSKSSSESESENFI